MVQQLLAEGRDAKAVTNRLIHAAIRGMFTIELAVLMWPGLAANKPVLLFTAHSFTRSVAGAYSSTD